MVVFPETLTDNKAILCNFFFYFGHKKVISMRSLKKLKIKIFDASIWIMFASLFYDWAILFLLVVFIAIYIYEPKNLKNWLVPITAIFAVFMICSAYLVLTNNHDFLFTHYQFSILFNAGYYLNWASSSKLIIYMLVIVYFDYYGLY